MSDRRVLDGGLAALYAGAVVAICRADDHLSREVGLRLEERIEARAGCALPLDDVLLAEPLEPVHIADALREGSGPFRRGSIDPDELARIIVVDAIAIVLAKGHVSEREAQQIMRYAAALGLGPAQIIALTDQLRPWLGVP